MVNGNCEPVSRSLPPNTIRDDGGNFRDNVSITNSKVRGLTRGDGNVSGAVPMVRPIYFVENIIEITLAKFASHV